MAAGDWPMPQDDPADVSIEQLEADAAREPSPRTTRLWDWLAHVTNPTGVFLYGRFSWERRFAGWLLSWWGWAFMYTDPWRPGKEPKNW